MVGEVPCVFLERISGGYQKEATLRKAGGGGVGVGDEDRAEWIQENRVLGRGNINAAYNTDG